MLTIKYSHELDKTKDELVQLYLLFRESTDTKIIFELDQFSCVVIKDSTIVGFFKLDQNVITDVIFSKYINRIEVMKYILLYCRNNYKIICIDTNNDELLNICVKYFNGINHKSKICYVGYDVIIPLINYECLEFTDDAVIKMNIFIKTDALKNDVMCSFEKKIAFKTFIKKDNCGCKYKAYCIIFEQPVCVYDKTNSDVYANIFVFSGGREYKIKNIRYDKLNTINQYLSILGKTNHVLFGFELFDTTIISNNAYYKYIKICSGHNVRKICNDANVLFYNFIFDVKLKESYGEDDIYVVKYDAIKIHDEEYCYIVHEREFINANMNVYKIGRTKQLNNKRFKQYPKGSVQKIKEQVSDCIKCEREIKQRFNKIFTQRKDIGIEYYEGKYDDIEQEFIKIVNKYKTI